MATIRLGAAANVRDFQYLLNALADGEHGDVLDREALDDEFGRFRVWSGNLGVLQKGHSSLDYRLRDAPLFSNEVLKLLKELEDNLRAANEIVTGARLPYEKQEKSDVQEQDDEDGFFSEEEDEEPTQAPDGEAAGTQITASTSAEDGDNGTADDAQGLLPRDKQRRTAFYDYASEKQMSHSEAKQFYQRHQLESQYGGSQAGDGFSPVIRAKTLPVSFGGGDGSESGVPRTELSMRFHEVVDIIDNLYKISVRIRAPTVRTRSLKAASYQPKDPETGVDIFEQYALFDIQHVHELVRHLRASQMTADGEGIDENDTLLVRLARAVTLRRRQFKYWRRHRDKLGVSTYPEELPQEQAAMARPEAPQRNDTLEGQPGNPGIDPHLKIAPSQKTGKTLLSGTEATHHHQSLDDIVDSKSVTSYAVTVKDLSGKGIDLPPPPKAAEGDRDFECPYCFIICPARYGKGRPWRTHVLQDLQPYVCTYTECHSSDQLFRSRRDWIEHESSHRKAWRCPEHPDAIYKSHAGLEEHLRQNHGDSIPEGQLSSIVKVGETYTIDQRPKCPICCASVDVEGMGTLQNHIANHLERIAAFSLPAHVDDDSDGGSSRASRGGTESSAMPSASMSSDVSDFSDESVFEKHDSGPSVEALSESLIRALPDDSGQRLGLLFTDQVHDEERTESDESIEEDTERAEAAIEKHMAAREAFREYLLSLPDAHSVRFYKRYGGWRGTIDFKNEESATMALQSFDMARYPKVRLQQKGAKKDTLDFSVVQEQQTKQLSFLPKVEVADASPPASVSSGTEIVPGFLSVSMEAKELSPIRTVAEIPNLRALYQAGELLQRDDQSYVPKDAYNEIMSFIYYDITRLKVDAIVNSANRSLLPSKADWTLNSKIHSGAGPELQKECSQIETLKVSQSVLTGGYHLPCTHIIHVVRPRYSDSKGMGQYNILTECYRSSLRLAMNSKLKTIAFCCLGTGGVGFPARIAARVALHETREFLDAHPMHGFERIVFCVYAEDDLSAFTDFFPVFFPPTPHNVEQAIATSTANTGSRVSALIQEVRTQTDAISLANNGAMLSDMIQEVRMQAKNIVPQVEPFSVEAARRLSRISILLDYPKGLFTNSEIEAPDPLSPKVRYLNLLCSVMLAICGNMTEMIELAKGKAVSDQPNYEAIWNDYDKHMYAYQGLTIINLLGICRQCAQYLYNDMENDVDIAHLMKTNVARLSTWLTKQTGDGPQNVRDHFEEVMLTREYQRDAPPKTQSDTVKLYQVPTLSQLYDLGALKAKSTHHTPSEKSNYVVCLTREDITRLEVDVLVSSTDTGFSGMGRLDRSVFSGGGLDLQEECANHAPCNEGEVVLTGGYSLPVKHVLHAVPPAIYRTDTQNVLREMYRKILHMASFLKATSITIPSLGTGMLGYPRRDSAAIAIQEVKQFLETMDESNPIEKIVFVVYSSSDEFVYKSLMPVYFPPLDFNPEQFKSAPVMDEGSSPPPRTLFGTIGEAFRKISYGKRPATSTKRQLEPSEEDLLIIFETHAQECLTCHNISKIYSQGKDLCEDGYRRAAQLLRHLHMKPDQSVHSLRSEDDDLAEIEVPDVYPLSLELLHTVEKSFRDLSRDRPFVSNQPALGKIRRPDFTTYKTQITIAPRYGPERTFGRIHIWSDPASGWDEFSAPEPTLHLNRGSLIIREGDVNNVFQGITSLSLTPRSRIRQQRSREILVDNGNADIDEEKDPGSRFVLKFQSQIDCEMVLIRLRHAAENSPSVVNRSAKDEPEKALAQVSFWAHQARRWESFEPEAFLRIYPGYVDIVADRLISVDRKRLGLILTRLSMVRKHSDTEILLDNVFTKDKPTEDIRRYMLTCSSQSNCDVLLSILIRAVENSPHEDHFSTVDDAYTEATSSKQNTSRKDTQVPDEDSELPGTNPSRDSQTEPLSALDLPSVPKEDPVERTESAIHDTKTPAPLQEAERIDPHTDIPFPGYLESRILTYIGQFRRDENATISEQDLATALSETPSDINTATFHLHSLDMITPVPGLERTWTMTPLQKTVTYEIRRSQRTGYPPGLSSRPELSQKPKDEIEIHELEA